MNNKDINILTNKELYELRCEQSKESKEKIEFIEGVLVCSSSTSILHNKIVFRLASAIDMFLDGSKCDVFADGIEIILEEGEKGTYIKPDVFITCNTTYNKQSVTSIPLVVFEVISEGNPENDYVRKMKLYRKYGIREYNIIEQNGLIIQHTLQGEFYHVTNTFKKGDIFTSSIFDTLEIDTTTIFKKQS